jgi:hypothetical protein
MTVVETMLRNGHEHGRRRRRRSIAMLGRADG